MKYTILFLLTFFFNSPPSFALAHRDSVTISQNKTIKLNNERKHKIPFHKLQVLAIHVQAIGLIAVLIVGNPTYLLFQMIRFSTILAFIFYLLAWYFNKGNPKKRRMIMIMGQISAILASLSLLYFIEYFL